MGRLFLSAPADGTKTSDSIIAHRFRFFHLFPKKSEKKAPFGKIGAKTIRASARAVDKYEVFVYNRID